MSYKKFENNDLIYNTIKTKPRFEFKIWGGKALINTGVGLAILNDYQVVSPVFTPSTPVTCTNPNSFDFSCEENSHNIGII